MELTQLRYFQALAKNGNLTQTANQLYLSPPSLSVSISRLERELGVSLFDRVGRRLYLNTCGLAFLNRVDGILSSLDHAVAEVTDLEGQREETVFVATTSPNVFQSVFLAFLRDHPDFKLSHTSLRLEQVSCEDLLHKYDVLLASPQDFVPTKALRSRVLYSNDFAVLMVHPDSPYAGYKHICLRTVKDEPFVALSPGYSSRKFFDEVCAAAGFRPNIVMECDYTMRAFMVMQKAGVTIATAHTKKLRYCGGATAIPIDPPFTPRVQSIYWDPARYQNKAAAAFLDYVCAFFKGYSFEIG